MCFSTLCSILITPIIYSIIWFERDNHNRTLINCLVSSALWVQIAWNVLVQPWTLVRYMFGPFDSPIICTLDVLIRNSTLVYINIIQNSIFVVQYMCLFHVKNPTALHEGFWQICINVWAFLYASITQLVYSLLPGKNPINYYLCVGQFPLALSSQSVKFNYPHVLTGILSLVSFVFIKLSAIFLKEKMIEKIQKNTHPLFSFATHATALTLISMFALVLARTNVLGARLIIYSYLKFCFVNFFA
jgi:hypothetical protein